MTQPAVAPIRLRPRRFRLLTAVACLAAAGCTGQAITAVASLESSKEASEIAVLLQRFGVTSATLESRVERRTTNHSVFVDPAETTAARYILDQLGLPRDDRGGLESLMDGGGVIPSKLSERGRLMHATADKLSRTLESHSRALTARVHIVVPSEKLLGGTVGEDRSTTPSASVYLRWLPHWTSVEESPGAMPADAPEPPPGEEAIPSAAALAEISRDEKAIMLLVVGSLKGDKGDYEPIKKEIPRLKDREDLGQWVQLRASEVTDLMMGTTPPGAPISRSEIATLVANAVEGLSTLDVRVVYEQVDMVPGRVDSASGQFEAEDPVIRNLLALGQTQSGGAAGNDFRVVLMAGLLAAAAVLFWLIKSSATARPAGQPAR